MEVRRHADGHDELGMDAHEHEPPVRRAQPPRLAIERCEIREVLVDQADHDEVVGPASSPLEPTSASIARS
jgi:hypothetical protein